jgi:hypothetical protein
LESSRVSNSAPGVPFFSSTERKNGLTARDSPRVAQDSVNLFNASGEHRGSMEDPPHDDRLAVCSALELPPARAEGTAMRTSGSKSN